MRDYDINQYNAKLMENLKADFGKDLYLNLDNEISNNIIRKPIRKIPLVKYVDEELLAETARRAKFEFNRKLKSIYISEFASKFIYSHSTNGFLKYNEVPIKWQENVFGASEPHIIKILNEFPNLLPEVANGYLGIQGFSDEVQIQSIFAGSGMDTRRAAIPAWTIRKITSIFNPKSEDIILGRRLELDMSDAKFMHLLYSDQCLVQQKIYAHQTIPSLLVHEIEIEFYNSSLEYVTINLPKGQNRDVSSHIQFLPAHSKRNDIRSVIGETLRNDQENHEQKVYASYHVIPDQLKVNQSKRIQKFYYLLSVNENRTISKQHFNDGEILMEKHNNLFKSHTQAWKQIWSFNALLMVTSDKIDVPLITAQYLLMTNAPSFGRVEKYGSIGSTGLGVISNQGVGDSLEKNCNGRIEYSQELWMIGFQSIVNPLSVKALLMKRIQQLPIAKRNAKRFGFLGARFPVVTNEIGDELCPKELCQNIHFPTGMVALALKRYLLVTGDHSMFTKDTGITLLTEINKYWLSVLKQSTDILTSSGPSFMTKVVKNSVFNLGLLKEVLLTLPELAVFLDSKHALELVAYMSELKNVSNIIQIPFDRENNYNPPHYTFNAKNDKIDFPDGVMLRYPLYFLVHRDAGLRNVEVYDQRLVNNPSPMALSSMFIGEMENEKFQSSFTRWDQILKFADNKFKIWTNDSQLWLGSYIPAATSYLDSIMYGLLGLRIRDTGLYLKPVLLRPIKKIQLSCIFYHGSTIQLTVDSTKGIIIELIVKERDSVSLGVEIYGTMASLTLTDKLFFKLGSFLVIKRIRKH